MTIMPDPNRKYTEAEYLEFERASEFKHEFFDGYIYAMSGGSSAHSLIGSSVIAALYSQLRKRPCNVYNPDMKVRIPATGSYAYPDVSVMCGEAQFDDQHRDVLLNPTVIVEVLSPSTEARDRGMKFQQYRSIATLQEYILIAQDKPLIERFARRDGGVWQLSEARGLDATITLAAVDCTLHLAEVYEQVTFDDERGAGGN